MKDYNNHYGHKLSLSAFTQVINFNKGKGGITYEDSSKRNKYTCFYCSEGKVYKTSVQFKVNSRNPISPNQSDERDGFIQHCTTLSAFQKAILTDYYKRAEAGHNDEDGTHRIFACMELVAEWLCCRSASKTLQSIDSWKNYFDMIGGDKYLQFSCGEFTFTMLVILALSYIEMKVAKDHYHLKFTLESFGTKSYVVSHIPEFSDDSHARMDFTTIANDYWKEHRQFPTYSIVQWSQYCITNLDMNYNKDIELIVGAGITTRATNFHDNAPLYAIIQPKPSPYDLSNDSPTFEDFQKVKEKHTNFSFYSIYGTILPHELHPFTVATKPEQSDKKFTLVRTQSYNHSARNALGERSVAVKSTELVSDFNFFLRPVQVECQERILDCEVADMHLKQFTSHLWKNLDDLRSTGNIARCEIAAKIISPDATISNVLRCLFESLCLSLREKTNYYDSQHWATIINFFATGIIYRYRLTLETLSKHPQKQNFLWPILSEAANLIGTFYSGKTTFANHYIYGKKMTFLMRRLCLQSLPHICADVSQLAPTTSVQRFLNSLKLEKEPTFVVSKLPMLIITLPPIDACACNRCFCVYYVPNSPTYGKKLDDHHLKHPCLRNGPKDRMTTKRISIKSDAFKEHLRREIATLDRDQTSFLDRMLDASDTRPIFLTGAAGSGKSTALKIGIKCLLAREGLYTVAALALTKTAAMNIGGQTFHSYFALDHTTSTSCDAFNSKLLLSSLESCADHSKDKLNHIRNYLKYLIIDECSMLTGKALDEINEFLKQAKDNQDVPFGGVQLILCGDPLQSLPFQTDEKNNPKTKDAFLFFQSHVWYNKEYPFSVYHLLTAHRQEEDGYLLELLNKIRIGDVTQAELDDLGDKAGSNVPKDYVFDVVSQALEKFTDVQLQNDTIKKNLKWRARTICPFKEVRYKRLGLGEDREICKLTRRNVLHDSHSKKASDSCNVRTCYAIVCEHSEADYISKVGLAYKESSKTVQMLSIPITANWVQYGQNNEMPYKKIIQNAGILDLEVTLKLCIGQLVVFTVNSLSPYVSNGSFGVIKDFIWKDEKVFEVVISPKCHDNRYEIPDIAVQRVTRSNTYASLGQFPIKPASYWTANTVQGLTLDGMPTVILNERWPSFNFFYTTMSRFRSLLYFCFLHRLVVSEVKGNIHPTSLAFILYHMNVGVKSFVDYERTQFCTAAKGAKI